MLQHVQVAGLHDLLIFLDGETVLLTALHTEVDAVAARFLDQQFAEQRLGLGDDVQRVQHRRLVLLQMLHDHGLRAARPDAGERCEDIVEHAAFLADLLHDPLRPPDLILDVRMVLPQRL